MKRAEESDKLKEDGTTHEELRQMMKQAQQLQGRMAEMQAEMERLAIEGRSAAGWWWSR